MNCMYRTLIATVALAVSSVTASAETITVCASGCDYFYIRDAISAANQGDVIQLAPQVYQEGIQLSTFGKAITVRGAVGKDGRPVSVIDGRHSHIALICQNGEGPGTRFENLVLLDGSSSGGGACFSNHASPTIVNCDFVGGSAQTGGGIQNYAGSPVFIGCRITGCSAGIGAGGVDNGELSSPTFIDCEISGNTQYAVGGLLNRAGSKVILVGSVVCGNINVWGDDVQISGEFEDGSGNCEAISCDKCFRCLGDIDGSGVVDASDLGLLVALWNSDGSTLPGSDINGDGVVQSADLGLLISAWGPCDK